MKDGGWLLAAFCLVFILFTGVAFIEMMLPVITKAKLDTICASYSEQMAISQVFSSHSREDLLKAVQEAGLEDARVETEDLAALKRGERARFFVQGQVPARIFTSWLGFGERRYPYQFERFIVCRFILN